MEANDAGSQSMRRIVRLSRRRRVTATGNWCQRPLAQFLLENGRKRAEYATQVLEVLIRLKIRRWFIFINDPTFIRLHTQQSETLLICQKLSFAPKHFDEMPRCYFHFMDFDHARNNFVHSSIIGMVEVLSSCDGLVLVRRENDMSLILTNPITRKLTKLPPSTNSTTSSNGSYSLTFSNKENTYKVVHLFSEVGCEILSISTRKLKLVEGFSSEELPNHRPKMVDANGSMYWTPRYRDGRDYFITLNLQDEKCITRNLPNRRRINDRLLEIGGVLGFVSQETRYLLHVWILDENDYKSNSIWVKRCSICLHLDFRRSVLPVCCPRNGKDIVFVYARGMLYVRDFDKGDMNNVSSKEGIEGWHYRAGMMFVPHRNTLASWPETQEETPC